jgi:hypothetical protein
MAPMRADSIENTMKAMMWRQDGLSAIFAKALILRSSSDRRRSQQIELMLSLCTLPAWKYRADMSAKKSRMPRWHPGRLSSLAALCVSGGT